MSYAGSLKRWLCWFAAPLILFLPLLFIPQVMYFGNSDALFYSNILALMTDALKSGVFFPRWFSEANAGFGSPVMMFYSPLAYSVTAILNLPFALFHPDIGTQLLMGMYASQVVSGYTAYLWLKRDFDERVALAGSLLFIVLPYKFIYIYLHINLAQLWALALLPLWMMAARDIIYGGRRAIGAYALALAGVYYTHTLTLIAFGAVPAVYALWFGRRQFWRTFWRLGGAHVLGVGICAAQALPSHFYMEWIHADLFLKGNYSWQNNFYHIDVVLCAYYGIIAALVGVAIRKIPSLRDSPQARHGVFWIYVLCIVLFLTQRPSTWIWEMLPPLQYLQFPAARLHAPALLAVIYLICMWLTHYAEMELIDSTVYRRWTLALLIVAFTASTGQRLYHIYSDPANQSETYLGRARVAKLITTPVPIYETRWGCIDAKPAFALYEAAKLPPAVAITSGTVNGDWFSESEPESILLNADVQSEQALVTVRQCYIPLWRANNELGGIVKLAPSVSSGLIEFTLPHGAHQVTIALATPPSEKLAHTIALIALVLCLLLMPGGRKKRRTAYSKADYFP